MKLPTDLLDTIAVSADQFQRERLLGYIDAMQDVCDIATTASVRVLIHACVFESLTAGRLAGLDQPSRVATAIKTGLECTECFALSADDDGGRPERTEVEN